MFKSALAKRTFLFALAAASSLFASRASAQDVTPPTCEIVQSAIYPSPERAGYLRFMFYVKATDETELQEYDPYSYPDAKTDPPKGPIEFRANVDGKGFNTRYYPPAGWQPWPNDLTQPIYIDVKCTTFHFEVRSVDAAGNPSVVQVKNFKAPFPAIKAPLKPKFSAPLNLKGGSDAVVKLLAGPDFDGDGTEDIAQCYNIDPTPTDTSVDDQIGKFLIRRNAEGDGQRFTDLEPDFGMSLFYSFAVGHFGNKTATTGNDTLPDLVTAQGGDLRVRINQGLNGSNVLSFQAGQSFHSDTHFLHHVAVADFNGDGFDDIIVTAEPYNADPNRLLLFLNKGDGTFADPLATDLVASFVRNVTAGDLNGDGRADIVVTEKANGVDQLVVFLNDGTGVLGSGQQYFAQYSYSGDLIRDVAIGDVTGDGKADIVFSSVGTYSDFYTQNYFVDGAVEVLLQGDANIFTYGKYFHAHNLNLGKNPSGFSLSKIQASVALADVNFDQKLDIVTTSNLTPTGKVLFVESVLDPASKYLDLLVVASSPFTNGGKVRAVSVADLDGNSKMDIVGANESTTNPGSVILNLTPGGVSAPKALKVAVTGDTNFKDGVISGWDFIFSTVLTDSVTGLKLRVQSTLTPDDESSWTDLTGGGFLVKQGVNNWRLSTTDLPTGLRYFRVVASAPNFKDQKSPAIGPITVLPPVFSTDVAFAQVKAVTPKLALTGYKGDTSTKVNRGEIGVFAVKITNTGSKGALKIQGPASAGNGKFLAQYSELPDFSGQIITSKITAGTYSTADLPHGATHTIYARFRVSALAAKDEAGPFAITAKSMNDTAKSDTGLVTVNATDPAGVFFVTDLNENGANSFGAAIFYASKNFKKKTTIKFELPVPVSGPATLSITNAVVPLIAKSTVIDGSSQADYVQFVTGASDVAEPAVAISGPGSLIGLQVFSGDCDITGLKFANFATGLNLHGKGAVGNVITRCVFQGNASAGVSLSDGATRNYIGDGGEGNGNVFVSFDNGQVIGDRGIHIYGLETEQNRVLGNHLGYSPTDTSSGLSKGFNIAAVSIGDAAQANYIGSKRLSDRNYIAGNRGGGQREQPASGVQIFGVNTTANFVSGNQFGFTAAGDPRANAGSNILIELGASDNIIGGTDAGAGNLIQNSQGFGVEIKGVNIATQKNRIENNLIGGYDDDHGNRASGVIISGNAATGNIVGGAKKNAGNTIIGNGEISGNAGIGLVFSSSNSVLGNFIGTDPNNTAAPNIGAGIFLLGANKNVIGSAGLGANVISGNKGVGVAFSGSSDNTVYANKIGVGFDGITAIPNTRDAITLQNGSHRNVIGGITAGLGNIIRENGGKAIFVTDSSANNPFRGNSIRRNGLGLEIDLVGGSENAQGATANDTGDPDPGANELQNCPVLTGAKVVGSKTTITGTFNSLPRENALSTPVVHSFHFDVYADGVFVGTLIFDTDNEGDPVVHSTRTDGNGNGQFSIVVPKNLTGKSITVTATHRVPQGPGSKIVKDGSTSEFSNTIVAVQ